MAGILLQMRAVRESWRARPSAASPEPRTSIALASGC